MDERVVRLERRGRAALITPARPSRLNAISSAVVTALDATLSELEDDAEIRALVITGEGRAFSAGADIAELDALDGPIAFAGFIGRFQRLLDRLQAFPKPSITAVN